MRPYTTSLRWLLENVLGRARSFWAGLEEDSSDEDPFAWWSSIRGKWVCQEDKLKQQPGDHLPALQKVLIGLRAAGI